MKISIICPIYNGEKYIKNLNENIQKQKLENSEIVEVLYALTRCNDNSENILKELKCNYTVIDAKNFSHSKTREDMSKKIKGDILVFISQDIIIKNNFWLNNLVNPIINNECEASFSRQIGQDNNIEKYTRQINYPKESRIVSKADIPKYEIRTFFYSDASSAVDYKIYKELKAYDNKVMPTNEDMYFAHKLIYAGYRIKYCADSEVYHSHDFTYKQLYKRYFDTGIFFRDNPYFNKYKSNQSGIEMAKYVLKSALKDRNYKVVLKIVPNFAIRFIGKVVGEHKKDKSIPEFKKIC